MFTILIIIASIYAININIQNTKTISILITNDQLKNLMISYNLFKIKYLNSFSNQIQVQSSSNICSIFFSVLLYKIDILFLNKYQFFAIHNILCIQVTILLYVFYFSFNILFYSIYTLSELCYFLLLTENSLLFLY